MRRQHPEIASPGLLTEAQAAALLALKPQTLANWRCTRRQALPYVQLGGAIRYRQRDIQQFIEERIVAANA